MSHYRLKGLILLLILISAYYIWNRQWHNYAPPETLQTIAKLKGQLVARPAPGFVLEDESGQKVSLSSLQGKVVFLNFWASFCEPCRKEMPSMEHLVRQYKDQGLVMVAISQDPKKEDMLKFMETFLPHDKSAMTVLWDHDGSIAKAYGTKLIPETYLIDTNGVIVAQFVNAYDWSTPEVKSMIETLLTGEKRQRFF